VGTVSDDRNKAHRESSLIRWRGAVLDVENVSEKGERDDTGIDRCVNTAAWLSRGMGLPRYECFTPYVHTESVFGRLSLSGHHLPVRTLVLPELCVRLPLLLDAARELICLHGQ